MSDFVGLAVAVGVFKYQQAVAGFAGRRAFGVIRPGSNPKPAFGVERHLHRLDEFGELRLAGEQVHFAAVCHSHVFDRLLGVKIRTDIDLVRLQRFHRRHVRVIHFQVATPGCRPDAPVAVGGHHIALGHFLLHNLAVGNHRAFLAGRREFQFRSSAINVVPAEFFQMTRRRLFVEKGLEDFRRKRLVAGLGEQEGVEGERMPLLRRLRVKPLRHREEVHEQHVVGLRHLGHRGGVEFQVGVVRRRIREIRVVKRFIGDRREKRDARRAFAAVVLRFDLLEKLVEVLFEFIQTLRALEGLVEAVKGQNDIRLRLGQPIVARTEVLGAMPGCDLIAGGGEVAENEVVVRKFRVNERLQETVVLHPVGERVAEVTDVVALVQGEHLRAECIGAEQNEQDDQAGQVFHG